MPDDYRKLGVPMEEHTEGLKRAEELQKKTKAKTCVPDDIDRICLRMARQIEKYADDDVMVEILRNHTILPEMVKALREARQYIGFDTPERSRLRNNIDELIHPKGE